jgi:hypothetical protein
VSPQSELYKHIVSETYHPFSSWRQIKRDFLHHFHKPRLDLLVWTLTVKLTPVYYRKLDRFLEDNGRHRELASWRKAFKQQWTKLANTPTIAPINPKYRPDPRKWVCTCPYFSTSRFLCCKHLVHAVHPVMPKFFIEVKRNRMTPFWSHPLLVPVDADSEDSYQGDVPTSTDSGSQILADGDDDDDEEAEDMILGGNNGTLRERLVDHIKTLRDFCDGLEYQIQFEDQRMLATVEREGAGLFRLANNCLSRERRFNSTRSPSPTTWERTTTCNLLSHATSFFGC